MVVAFTTDRRTLAVDLIMATCESYLYLHTTSSELSSFPTAQFLSWLSLYLEHRRYSLNTAPYGLRMMTHVTWRIWCKLGLFGEPRDPAQTQKIQTPYNIENHLDITANAVPGKAKDSSLHRPWTTGIAWELLFVDNATKTLQHPLSTPLSEHHPQIPIILSSTRLRNPISIPFIWHFQTFL